MATKKKQNSAMVGAVVLSFLKIQNSITNSRINFCLSYQDTSLSMFNMLAIACQRDDTTKCDGYIEMVVPQYSLDTFQQHFRLSRGAFELILQYMSKLHEHMKNNKAGRPQLTLEKKILITVWYLGNQESIRSIADRFGVTTFSVFKSTREICFSIVRNLMGKFIQWPTCNEETLRAVQNGFNSGLQLPGCIGCIDSTHIPIKAPQQDENAYVNRKGFHSVILQGVCDHQRKFIDVFCGCVGSTHDATVLRSSPLYEAVCDRKEDMFPGQTYIIGDQAYPLQPWLLKKFQDNGRLRDEQLRFNQRLSSKRQLIEQAFGILKGRFRRLKMMDIDIIPDIPVLVGASCTLHNICSQQECDIEAYLELEDVDISGQRGLYPDSTPTGVDPRCLVMTIVNA